MLFGALTAVLSRVEEKDYDNLIEFVGNRFDRVGKNSNRKLRHLYPDEDSDDSTKNGAGSSWLSKVMAPKAREKPAIDPEFAARLGDAASIAASRCNISPGQRGTGPMHNGTLNVGVKKRRSIAAAARRAKTHVTL